MKVIAIIQARMESTRLPGKVLKSVAGMPMLERIVDRICRSQNLDEVIVATSRNRSDDEIEDFCKKQHILCFRGDERNVLERYYLCAKEYQGEVIMRLTGDNVFVDAEIIDQAIDVFLLEEQLDYLYYREGLPLGVAVEVFTMEALERANKETGHPDCQEHVTLYMHRNPDTFSCMKYVAKEDYGSFRLTMDTAEDYQVITMLYERLLKQGKEPTYKDAVEELLKDGELRKINSHVKQVVSMYGLDKDSGRNG